jgi:hypothetical protein
MAAICSADPDVLARGPAALDLLCHADAFERREARAEGLWLGVCGRPAEISIAEVDEAGARGHERLCTAVAGEIANHTVLCRELGVDRYASPAGLVLAAYRAWRRDLFAHLEGVFALVVVDLGRDLVLAGPDPYGVAYLHVVRLGRDVLISTEAKAFLADPRFRVVADEVSLSSLVALGHEFGRGLFAGVDAASQGCHFEIERGVVSTARHWEPRDSLGALTGPAYVARLRETVEELAAEAFGAGDSLLPLTGGLDSRLLAATRPTGASFKAITFGTMRDSDVLRAAQIAAACGMPHQAIPFEPDYVARHALATTWVTEGRLTPAENTTGFQMAPLADREYFVSGVDCGLGRRFSKAKTAFPDWSLVGPDNPALDAWLMLRFSRSGMSPEEAALAFGRRAQQVRDPGIAALSDYIGGTRGLCGVDRLDLYFVGGRARGWRCSGLDLASVWITPRAPFFNRRWIEAVLSGAPAERLDDLPRLRLIQDLDAAVARVPWVTTRLPLRESRYVLEALRRTSRLRRVRPPGGGAGAGAALSTRKTAFTRRYMSTVKSAYHRIYTYGDHRDEWLRTASRAYLEDVLLSDRCAERGFADARGVRTLVDEHMAGADHTLALSILLGIELWHRLFVDGERPGIT